MTDYDPNESVEAIITMVDNKGEESMRVHHASIDIIRLTNLIQIFTAGRYDKDRRMVIDIAYSDPEVVDGQTAS